MAEPNNQDNGAPHYAPPPGWVVPNGLTNMFRKPVNYDDSNNNKPIANTNQNTTRHQNAIRQLYINNIAAPDADGTSVDPSRPHHTYLYSNNNNGNNNIGNNNNTLPAGWDLRYNHNQAHRQAKRLKINRTILDTVMPEQDAVANLTSEQLQSKMARAIRKSEHESARVRPRSTNNSETAQRRVVESLDAFHQAIQTRPTRMTTRQQLEASWRSQTGKGRMEETVDPQRPDRMFLEQSRQITGTRTGVRSAEDVARRMRTIHVMDNRRHNRPYWQPLDTWRVVENVFLESAEQIHIDEAARLQHEELWFDVRHTDHPWVHYYALTVPHQQVYGTEPHRLRVLQWDGVVDTLFTYIVFDPQSSRDEIIHQTPDAKRYAGIKKPLVDLGNSRSNRLIPPGTFLRRKLWRDGQIKSDWMYSKSTGNWSKLAGQRKKEYKPPRPPTLLSHNIFEPINNKTSRKRQPNSQKLKKNNSRKPNPPYRPTLISHNIFESHNNKTSRKKKSNNRKPNNKKNNGRKSNNRKPNNKKNNGRKSNPKNARQK